MVYKILIFFIVYCFFDSSQGIVPDYDKKVTRLIEDYGYLVETHHVVTKDGYILEIHRIPGIQGENVKTGKNPVLMMHGILSSSADWVVTGPNSSLVVYHKWPDSMQICFHEFGIYDLPATIDYVLNETNTTDLNYICISQGCTQFFVMGSLRQEYNKKIRFTAALAPAAYLNYVKGLFAFCHNLILSSKVFVEKFGHFEFLPALSIIRILIRHFCQFGNPWQNLCYIIIFLVARIGIDEMDPQRLSHVTTYFPAGCSWKQLIHFHIGIEKGAFCQYDYGSTKNLLLYNSTVPPNYPIENVDVPIAIFYGANDFLTSPPDVLFLASKLPKVIGKFIVRDKKLNQLDFVIGKNVQHLVNKPLLKILNTFRK